MSNLKEQLIGIQRKLQSLTIEIDNLIEQIPSEDRDDNLQSLVMKIVLEKLPQSPEFMQSLAREIAQQKDLSSQVSPPPQSADEMRSIDNIDLEKVSQFEDSFESILPQSSQNLVLALENPPLPPEPNPDDPLNKALRQLIDIYNESPEEFFRIYPTISVKESQDSIEKRRSSSSIMPVLSRADRANYSIVENGELGYLFPSRNLIVNEHNLDTVGALFRTRDYQPNYRGIYLNYPPLATVQKLAGSDEWVLVEKGDLIFM